MRFLTILAVLPVALAFPPQVKPLYWLLAGDSTTATNGGWGDGFLRDTVAVGSTGQNFGKNGASTKTFRELGLWSSILNGIKENKAKYNVQVTIQFGHNDQKNTTVGVTPEVYKSNLATFTREVKAAGGTPILVTSLTRRTFKDGKVVQNLENERVATIAVAEQEKVRWIDLNAASTKYINAIGQENAGLYNWVAGDRTHLNPRGEVLFGRLVSDLLTEKYGDYRKFTVKNETLSKAIKAGKVV